nr:glycosyltransferase family 2 protein [uncultured Lichenicoccus sp.]
MTTISVIITNYNYASYVVDAVESALSQTRSPAEVIVVDDGSTDGSVERLRARYGSDARVTLHLGSNQGQLGAFRQGLALATGQVVAFLDADDYWERSYLEQVTAVYDSQPDIDFIFTDLTLFGNEQGREAYSDRPVDIGYTALSTWMTGWWYGEATSALSMRRDWADRALDLPAGFLQTWKLSADACLVFGSSLQGAHKYYLPTGMVKYRVHGTNGWWHSKECEQRFLRRFRARSLINYYAREMAMDAATEDLIKLEFLSKTEPSHEEARRYALMALRSAVWWPRRLWRCYTILRRGTWWERGTQGAAPVSHKHGDLRIASAKVATAEP